MKKFLLLIVLIFPMIANANYQRNTARPVNNILFGQVESVRYITQSQYHPPTYSRYGGSEYTAIRSLAGGIVGGVIGHQFGRGDGRDWATVAGSVTGAALAANIGAPSQQELNGYTTSLSLIELLIKTEQGKLISVTQDPDPSMSFAPGDSVRILYFNDGVRVDKTY